MVLHPYQDLYENVLDLINLLIQSVKNNKINKFMNCGIKIIAFISVQKTNTIKSLNLESINKQKHQN